MARKTPDAKDSNAPKSLSGWSCIRWDDHLDDLRTKPTRQICAELGCSFRTVQIARASRGIPPPTREPRQMRMPRPRRYRVEGNTDKFSVRITPSQYMVAFRTRGDIGVSGRVRAIVEAQLAAPAWPEFIDSARDEGAHMWFQLRVPCDLRAAIYTYQQAVGCRDLSAAVRSLVTSGLAMGEGTEDAK